MERKAHWEQIFRTKALEAASWYQPRPETSLRLIAATGLGPDARILDVGAGAATLVDALLDAGYDRLGVLDVSGTALAKARRRLGDRAGQVEWFEADVTRFRSPHPWDLWHDRAVLHFLTEAEDRRRYQAVLLGSIVSGGHAIIATFGPEGPTSCSGLPVRRYDPARLQATLGDEWDLVEHFLEDHTTPSGAVQQFLYAWLVRT